jgi:hypothetical protein
MPAKTALPDEFHERLRQLAAAYLAADDPHLQGAGPVTRFAWLRKPAARHGSAAARGPRR